jgi:hypothetical protein
VFAGPADPVTAALAAAIDDPAHAAAALKAIETMPALIKRRILATFIRLLPQPKL